MFMFKDIRNERKGANMKFRLLPICLLVFYMTACGIYKTKGNDGAASLDAAALTADPNTQITYAQVNQLVISQSCLSCHSAAVARGGIILTTYAQVNAAINDMKDDIDSGDMPQDGALASSQVALFDQWFSQGHLEMGGVAPAPTATPIPTPTPVLTSAITFAQVNQNVFQTSCLRCHNSVTSSGGVILDTFANVTHSLSDVTADIDSGDMPADGPLTTAQKTMFDEWIASGATEFGTAATPTPAATATPMATPMATPIPSVTPTPTPVLSSGVNFAQVNQAVFQVSCQTCHGATNPSGGASLVTFANVTQHLSDVKADIKNGSMPKRATLTAAQLTVFNNWIADGAKEF